MAQFLKMYSLEPLFANPNFSEPVAKSPKNIPITARRIGLKDGIPYYFEETPDDIGLTYKFEKRGVKCTHPTTSRIYLQEFWRMEIKIPVDNTYIKPGDALIITETPYNTEFAEVVEFKEPYKAKKNRLPNTNDMFYEEALEAFEEAKFDCWEKGDYLTASILGPKTKDIDGKDRRSIHEDDNWVFGICSDPNSILDYFLKSKGGFKLSSFLNSVHYSYYLGPGKKKDERTGDIVKKKIFVKRELAEAVNDTKYSYFCTALYQAMAGPEKATELKNEPVLPRLKDIFNKKLHTRNQAETKRVKSSVSLYSTQEWALQKTELLLIDCIEDSTIDSPDKIAENEIRKQTVAEAFTKFLNAEELEVIKAYFGFNGCNMLEMKEIAKKLNLTYDKVRSRKNKALKKLMRYLKEL